MLSLAAAVLYLLVAGGCGVAAWTAKMQRQAAWHVRNWLIVTALFVLLAGFRLLALEEVLRDDLRIALNMEGAYENRRELQGPIVATILVIATALAGWWAHRVVRVMRGRRNYAATVALVAGTAMVMLLAIRLVSLHALDTLLYGPMKINWLADIGLSLIALASAIFYRRIVGGRA